MYVYSRDCSISSVKHVRVERDPSGVCVHVLYIAYTYYTVCTAIHSTAI